MNRIYRIIWSKAKEKWVVVSEKVKACGARPAATVGSLAAAALLAAGGAAYALDPGALPTGGQIVAGQGAISQAGSAMNVTQNSQRMIANWSTFNIGQNASVAFQQPNAAAVALNRIQDLNASQIMGSLSANGQVFLLNNAGVIFGKTAQVNVGGLVASSLNLHDSDFMAGKYNFFNNGTAGSVLNQGAINAMPGGVVALIAPKVSNEGSITANSGSVALAAGNKVSLDFAGDGLISLNIDEAAVEAQVANNGLIKADGGLVVMSARAAGSLSALAINNEGVVEANTLSSKNGRIILDGGDSGMTQTTGTISAKGEQAGETGGSITITGHKVGLFENAVIDATGQAGGGTVNIGGGFQGKDASIQNASQTVVAQTAAITANAITEGAGGKVVIWSNDYTGFGGLITAKGGATAGDGGFVEVSSKGQLNFVGMVDAGAVNGATGTLLLDPKNISIATGGGAVLTANALAFATNSGGDSTIAPSTITAVTNTGTAVTLQASNDITVDSLINTSNSTGDGGHLTLEAGRSITNNSIIITDNGNLTLIANSSNAGVVNADRDAGVANLINYGVINAGTGIVSMTIQDGGSGHDTTSGSIASGAVVASTLNITHNGPTAGGTIDIGSTTAKNMTVTSSLGRDVTNESGGVSVQGTQTSTATFNVGSGNITLTGDSTDLEIIKITNAHNVTLNDLNGLQLGASNITGFLDVTTHGPIGNTGAVVVTGQTTLNALTGGFGVQPNDINLTDSGNNFSTIWIKKGEDVDISDSNGFTLSGGINTIDGYLRLEAITGAITVGATTNAGGSVSINADGADTGAVTINQAVTSGGMYIHSSGTVAVNNALTSNGAIEITATDGDITSNASGELQAHDNVILDAQTPGMTGISLNADVTSTNKSITATTNRAFATTADLFATGNYEWPWDQGKVTVTAGDGGATFNNVSVDQEFSVTAANDITGTGVVSIANVSGFSKLSAGTYDITFTNAGNSFRNVYIPHAKNVTIKNQGAIFFTGIDSSGNLDITAGGSIASGTAQDLQRWTGSGYPTYEGSGVIDIEGTSRFEVTAANSDLILGNAANVFLGSVTMATSGAGTYRDLNFSNNTSVAAVIGGFPATSLRNVTLTFASAPSFEIPTISLTGNLAVSLSNATAGDGLTQTAGGITQAAGNTVTVSTNAAGNITLDSANNSFSNLSIPTANNVTVNNSTNLTLAGINTSGASGLGNFTLTNDGNVTQSGYVKVKGTASYDLSADHDLTLNSTPTWPLYVANEQNILKVVTARNVLVNETNNLTLDSSTISGTLTLTGYSSSLDQITDSTVLVTGTTTFSTFYGADGINLPSGNNKFGGLAINNSYGQKVYITENDPITQASAWSLGSSDIRLQTVQDQAITLDQNNSFTYLTLTQSGNASAPGDVLVTTRNNHLYEQAAWRTHGFTKLDLSSGYQVYLTNPDNIFGPLQVSNGSGSTTIYAKDWFDGTNYHSAIIDDSTTGRQWSTGQTTLYAYDGTGSVGNSTTGTINLTNQSNVLGNLVILGGTTTITEGESITDGSAWTTTGTTTLNSYNGAVTLDNLSNSLGALSVNVTGGAAVLVTDNTDLTQAAAWHVGASAVTLNSVGNAIDLSTSSGNVLGNINITVNNGTPTSVKIKENDAITQGSAWVLTGIPVTLHAEGANDINLTYTANQMGNLTITGNNVTITENAAIVQGSTAADKWTTTGTTTLNSLQNAITLENTGNVLGDIAITVANGTPASVSITEDHNITQASAWILPTKAITLNSQTHDVVLDTAGNQLGVLTVTAANAAITEDHAITNGDAWTVSGLTTLNATGNMITLDNSANDFGSLKISSASIASLTDTNAIVLDDITASSRVTLTSGGTISQTAGKAIITPSLSILGSGSASLANTGNNVATFAASFSGGDLSYTDADDFIVGNVNGVNGISIGTNDVTLKSDTGTISGLNLVSSSSNSLTVETATALTLQSMTIGGAQTYTAGGLGITLNAGILSDQSGAITFHSPVTLGADLTIQSHDSAITFNGAINGANNLLTVNAGTGAVDFKQAVSGLGTTSDPAVLTVFSSGSRFYSTLAANSGISITGPVIFDDNITLGNGSAGSVFSGMVTFAKPGGIAFSGYDGISFTGGVTLSGDTSINSNNSTLTFENNDIDGAYALTLDSGTGTIVGLDKVGNNLTSLDVTGYNLIIPAGGATLNGPQTYTATGGTSVRLDGDVTSTQDGTGTITFNSAVTVGDDVTVSTTNSAINFNGKVDSVNGSHNLVVNSGTAAKSFAGMIGSNSRLGSGTGAALELQGSGATTFSETVATNSGIVAAGPVTLTKNLTIGDGDTGTDFSGAVTLAGNMIINANAGNLDFDSTINGAYTLAINLNSRSL